MGKQTHIFLIFLLPFFCLPSYVTAQQASFFSNIQYITSDEGLSQSEVTCILQDQKGFLWVGTRGGLNRYDGYDFKIFQNEIGNPNSLVNNSIESLFEDSKGNIWIGTKSSGLSCYSPENDRFEHFQYHPKDTNTISGNRIIAIGESETGDIWVGTWGNGLTIINREKGKCLRLLGQIRINDMIRSRDGNMWLASGRGLYVLSSDGQLLNNYTPPGAVAQFIDVLEDQQSGKFYLGTWSLGLWEFDREAESFKQYQHQSGNPQSISSNNAYHLHQDRQGGIWVGSWGRGLNLFHPDTETFTPYNLAKGSSNQVKELYRDVLCVFQDRSGILWFGTNGGGLCKVDESVSQFGLMRYSGDASGFPNSPILSIMKDDEGVLWVGTKGNKALYYSRDGNSFSQLEPPDLFVFGSRSMKIDARKIYQSQDGTLLFASNLSLFKILKTKESYKAVPVVIQVEGVIQPVRLRQTTVLHQASDGIFWIGTQQRGLRKSLEAGIPGEQTFAIYTQDEKEGALKNNRVSAILEDEKKRTWIGTYGGLHLYRPESNDFLHFSKKQGDVRSLSSDIIICLHEDKRGNLWVGTPNGLNLAIPGGRQSWTFQCFQEKDGLPNNYIHAILEDDKGNLWISTNKGISKFDPEENVFYNFDVNDGLQSNSFMETAAFRDKNGMFFFGGIYGLNFFHPDSIRSNTTPPPVVLTGLKVFDKKVRAGSIFNDRVVLNKSIEYAKKISLTHNENVFSIDYTALDFRGSSRNSYMFKMEGLDEDWNFAGYQRSITYSNLGPGDYTFRVKAANNNEIWDESGASLQIEILPPFWVTWQAFLLYTIIFSGLLLLYRHIIYMQSELKNKLKLSQMEREKEKEMAEMKTRFFTNITHELRSPLTLISGPVAEILEGEKPTGKLKYSLMTIHHHTQRLLGLVNQLLDFRKAETGHMKIQVAKADFVKFAREIFLSFRGLADKNAIDFRLESSHKEIPLYFDQDKMEIVLCNLLSNAFKYSPPDSVITLSIRQEESFEHSPSSKFSDGYCEVSVKDNGSGMPAELVEKVFDRFYQITNTDSVRMVGTGIGLALVKSIVELHSGEIQVQSEVGKGSIFNVQLPGGKSHFSEEQILGSFRDSEHFSHYKAEQEMKQTFSKAVPPLIKKAAQESGKLLIVEDNPEIRSYVKRIFEEDFKVYEAENGLIAFELAKDYMPDLIISDIIMPEMDGLSLCKCIREEEKTAHIPVILLTARTSTVYKVEGYHSGADAYVTKPFSPPVLKAQVNSILEARKKLKEYFGKKITLQPTDIEISSLDGEFLDKAIKVVEDNLDSEELNREFLAQAVSMSPSTLYRKLKALTGYTTTAFIRSVRLKRAAQIMQKSQYNISEVAYQVGFNDLKYFRNCFKEQFGVNPSKFAEDSISSK